MSETARLIQAASKAKTVFVVTHDPELMSGAVRIFCILRMGGSIRTAFAFDIFVFLWYT
ncbi:MAG: hypothetical protein NC203_03945 [Firmicutes bacterium]|nr:hypothetical protein [[Eubacterium] siraeum]MCM1487500.1 hypothetical protein [Bacillota bacterium]